MKKSIKEMTGEEFGKHYRKRRIRLYILYILLLTAVFVIQHKAYRLIEPLLDYDYVCLEIYDKIGTAIFVITIILVLIIFLVFVIALLLRTGSLYAIYSTECDPAKYLEAEAYISKKCNFGIRSKQQKLAVANAYVALNDLESAWKILSELEPKDINSCSDIRILSAFAAYYINAGKKEESDKYMARLEAIKASGKKGRNLDLSMNHLNSAKAINEKRFDEARAYIDAYKDMPRLPRFMKALTEYNLGEIEYEEKNYLEAYYRYRCAVDLGGKNFFVHEAKKKLEEIRGYVA